MRVDKSKWKPLVFGDICCVSNGKSQKQVEDANGVYPIYGSGGFMGYASEYLCEAETTIIGRKGTINKPIFVKERFWNIDTAFGLYPKNIKDGMTTKYLFYLCSSIDFTSIQSGAAIPSLTKRDIQKLELLLPSISEQRAIAEELDGIQLMIGKCREQLEDYDRLARSIFYEMFGDPVKNDKGWAIKMIEDILEVTSSKRIFANEYQKSGVPFYRIKEIIELSHGKKPSVELYISQERYNEIKQSFNIPEVGDLLMTAVGSIGDIHIVQDAKPFYFKDGNVLWLKNRLKNESVFLKSIIHLLVEKFKEDNANGAAYKALTIVKFKKMPLPLPPLPLQQKFAERIEAIEKMKEATKAQLADLQQLFDSRMQYYFS